MNEIDDARRTSFERAAELPDPAQRYTRTADVARAIAVIRNEIDWPAFGPRPDFDAAYARFMDPGEASSTRSPRRSSDAAARSRSPTWRCCFSRRAADGPPRRARA